jgi:hypothetical protein
MTIREVNMYEHLQRLVNSAYTAGCAPQTLDPASNAFRELTFAGLRNTIEGFLEALGVEEETCNVMTTEILLGLIAHLASMRDELIKAGAAQKATKAAIEKARL